MFPPRCGTRLYRIGPHFHMVNRALIATQPTGVLFVVKYFEIQSKYFMANFKGKAAIELKTQA